MVSAMSLAGCANRSGLSHSVRSPEAVAEAVLAALADSSRDALEALLVTRDEHRDLLWPQLPERRDIEFEVARELNMRNTRKALSQMLTAFGGERFELVQLDLTDDAEPYDGFTIHYVRRFAVRRVSDGQEGTLPILDVLVERKGRWKPMNYDE
jgi:hypothetical protein